MSPKKQKRAQQIQRDDQGRLLLSGGLFAKKLVLTEEQASELQPLLDGFDTWRKGLRRWFLLGLILHVVAVPVIFFASYVVPMTQLSTSYPFFLLLYPLLVVVTQLNCKKQPWYRAYVDLINDLQKNAPRV